VPSARSAPAPVPDSTSLRRLADAAADCTACELYQLGQQTVFGEGPRAAQILLVGEQPGDIEDREGHVFVGPAGRMLNRILDEAGLDRDAVFLTNAVKHFRWKQATRGKRRLHQRPGTTHINACRPWLAAELRAVRPRVVVALGAVAGESLFGRSFSLTASRGAPLPWPPPDGPFAESRQRLEAGFATLHPSAVLRGDDAQRSELRRGIVADLAGVREYIGG
jgi:uracil-DNA glycosylase family protein